MRLSTLVDPSTTPWWGRFDRGRLLAGAAGIIGTSGWVLVVRYLNADLVRRGMDGQVSLAQVNVIVESGADVIARRARLFDLNISVWSVVGGN